MVASSSKTKKVRRNPLLYVGVIVVALFALWFVVISPVLTRLEKNRFEAAHSELKELAEKIQARAGPAINVVDSQSCGYASAKYSQGPRSCSINITIHYPGFTLARSNDVMTDIVKIKGGKIFPDAGNMNQERFENSDDYSQSFSQQFNLSNLLCSISYKYTDTTKTSTPTQEVTGMVISLHCGGSARAEHYPVKD